MLGIFLWVLVLIIWIANLVLRSTTLKGSNGNKIWIGLAIFWIIFAVVNIYGRISTLESRATVDPVEITTEEQTSSGEEIYYTEDSVY